MQELLFFLILQVQILIGTENGIINNRMKRHANRRSTIRTKSKRNQAHAIPTYTLEDETAGYSIEDEDELEDEEKEDVEEIEEADDELQKEKDMTRSDMLLHGW